MAAIKYIFFDIGYTLVNEDKVWAERCRRQAETEQARALGVTERMLLDELQFASDSFRSPWKSVIDKYGFTESARYKSEYETLYDDTRFVLENLSKRFCLGVIANQSGDLRQRLREWEILNYFKVVISSSDYGCSKPDERLFTAALDRSGCSANSAVMVGDRLDNDILPANKLGFTTVRVKRGFAKSQVPPSELYKPDFTVNDLTEILELKIMQN